MFQQGFKYKLSLAFQDLKIGLWPSLMLTLLIICGRWFGALQSLEFSVLDAFIHWGQPEETDSRITIIAIDEPTIQGAGQYPLSDRQLLELLQKIQAQKPHSIALDLFRDLPIPPDTKAFQEFIATQKNLFAIDKVLPITVDPPPGFPAKRLGFTDAFIDNDGMLRRTILGTQTEDGFRFSLVMLLAQDYLAQYDISLDNGDRDETAMQLGEVEIPRFYGRTGGYVQSTRAGAIETLIHFRRGQKPFNTYSAQMLLDGEIPADALTGQIILIGVASPSISDYFNAPPISSFNPDNELIYGVELQAHVLSQLLSGILDQRPLLRSPTEGIEYVWIFSFGLLGFLFAALEKSPVRTVLWTSITGLIFCAFCYGAFLLGWWLPLVPSLLLLGLNGYGLTAFHEHARNQKLRIHMQEQAIALLEVNNEILESKVTQRTAELKQAKEFAEASSLAKSNFLAHISHELRTPLNSILGFSQLLQKEEDLQSQNQDRVQMIYRSGSHLLTLINNILDLAKVESDKQDLNLQPFHLREIFATLDAIFRLRIEQKGIRFICQFADDCPASWIGDRPKLEQILINLLGNALKFTESGSIVLNIEPDRGMLKFSVADSGSGIHPDEIKKLFVAFEQTASGKSLGKGTGLGLAISYQLVQLMGGELQVTSEVGKGTTFFFSIPLEPVQDLEETSPKADEIPVSVVEAIADPNVVMRDVLTAEKAQQYFQQMDSAWQTQMQQAIASLNGKQIRFLIEQLPDEHQAFKEVLKELAQNYAFDTLEAICSS
ncbi:integral membrane sensor signal transduction histidine kinase [[Leptolyngbya] sp. PCC 7376]|uniref:CHASE2 domain-containing protein n=1 Tax=[Leptolyngbya] sp. PCC 7376 TaxID=111781 RepID=UPI00029F29E3|nr:CHASE2 domain-containing protein [[Leptolyngbya] sp. PCC 7376]AFY39518.1 integral membrane sensor signal transduction histidine kinase [[Leptolyngbya] sp. PCC 7376]